MFIQNTNNDSEKKDQLKLELLNVFVKLQMRQIPDNALLLSSFSFLKL